MKKFIKELCETIIVIAGMYVVFQAGCIYGLTKSEYQTKTYQVESYDPSDGYTTPTHYVSEVTEYKSGLTVIRDTDEEGCIQACNVKVNGKNTDITWLAMIYEYVFI